MVVPTRLKGGNKSAQGNALGFGDWRDAETSPERAAQLARRFCAAHSGLNPFASFTFEPRAVPWAGLLHAYGVGNMDHCCC
jgi:hypothetical protein